MYHNNVYQPIQPLRPYVFCYWVGHVLKGSDYPMQKFPATGYPSILVSFGDRHLKLRYYQQQIVPTSSVMLLGQYYNHLDAWLPEEMSVLGILFRPTAIWKLFGIRMSDITHQVFNAAELLGGGLQCLPHRLRDCSTDAERIGLIEEVLLQYITNHRPSAEKADSVLHYIQQTKGQVSVRALAKYFRFSERYIEKMFAEKVGLPPKYMARIVQFNYAVTHLIKNPGCRLTEVARRHGYTDQSHLIRSFIEFTGTTPAQYIRRDKDLPKWNDSLFLFFNHQL